MTSHTARSVFSGYEQTEKDRVIEEATGRRDRTFLALDLVFPGSVRLHRGKLTKFFGALGKLFMSAPTRVYGEFLLSFGLLTLLSHFAEYYFVEEELNLFVPLSVGLVCALLAVPFLLSGEPLCVALQKNALTDRVLFDFFCLKRMRASETVSVGAVSHLFGYLLGAAFAALGFFTSSLYVALGLIGLLVATLALSAPEFAFLLSLLLLPYLCAFPAGVYLLGGLVLLAVCSFGKKFLFGNRTLVVEQYDMLLILFCAFLLFRSVVADADVRATLFPVLFAFGYLLVSNLISNSRLAGSAEASLVFGSLPLSLFLLWQTAAEKFSLPKADLTAIGCFEIPFADKSLLTVFLAVLVLFAASVAGRSGEGRARTVFAMIALFFHFTAMLVAGDSLCRLVCTVLLLLFLALKNGRVPFLVTLGLLVVAAVTYFFFLRLPVAEKIADFAGLPAMVFQAFKRIISAAFSAFKEAPVFGVGGDYENYAESGVGSLVPSLYLGLALRYGAVGLFFLVLLVGVRFVHLCRYRRYLSAASMRTTLFFAAAGFGVLLLAGFVSDLFASFGVQYLTAVLFGLASAALRTAKHEYDDRLGYDEEHTPTASAADIPLG